MTGEERQRQRLQRTIPKPSSPPPSSGGGEEDLTRIGERSLVIQVSDRNLALFLVSVGVPLKTKPPFKHIELTSGEERWIFNFADRAIDGTKTKVLVEAYQNPEKHLGKDTAVSGALAILRNNEKFCDIEERSKPWRGYYHKKKPQITYWAKKDSQREQRLIERGYKRINPTRPDEAPKS